MNANEISVWFILAIVGLIAVILGICRISIWVSDKRKTFVLENSLSIKSIKALNQVYKNKFHDLNNAYYHRIRCRSKAAYDRMHYTEELIAFVMSRQSFFDDLLKKVNENIKIYHEYKEDCEYILKREVVVWEKEIYIQIEKELFEKEKIKPICSVNIKIEKEYRSPKGRNFYQDYRIYREQEIATALVKIKDREEYRRSKEYERSKMSDSLRYDIMQRDGFRCVLCGSKASDDIRLHVDHVIPVSKGGKTVKNNLRTLCQSCNLGKRDKYDPNGLN